MHSPLEQYLEEVTTHLHILPAAQRTDEVEEIRQHVEALVAARQELGHSREEAISQTLTQFGRAQTVGRQLARAYKRRFPSTRRSLALASVCALISCFGVNLLVSELFTRLGPAWVSPMYADSLPAHPATWLLSALIGNYAWGYMTGAITPRRAVAGMALVCTFLNLLNLQCIVRGYYDTPLRCAELVAFAVMALGFHTGLAMWGAHSGARWRQKRQQRRAQTAC